MIRIEFYGVLESVAGCRSMDYPLPDAEAVESVLSRLSAEVPGLATHLARLACAVDDRIVPRQHHLAPGATLALLPPVSGG